MKEEYALPDTPQWGGPELSRAGGALGDAVGEPVAHVVHEQVGEQVYRPVLQDRAEQRRCSLHLRRMTQRASYRAEHGPAPDRAGAWVGIWCRGVREPHQECELHPVRQNMERVVEGLVDFVVSAHAGHVIRLRLFGAVAGRILL